MISFLVHNVGYPRAIGAVSVINHFYGRDEIALGAFKGTFGQNIKGNVARDILKYFNNEKCPGVYIDDLVDNFDSPVKHYDQVEDAVTVLRSTLASAEDNSVVVVSLGFMTNIANLLSSSAGSLVLSMPRSV